MDVKKNRVTKKNRTQVSLCWVKRSLDLTCCLCQEENTAVLDCCDTFQSTLHSTFHSNFHSRNQQSAFVMPRSISPRSMSADQTACEGKGRYLNRSRLIANYFSSYRSQSFREEVDRSCDKHETEGRFMEVDFFHPFPLRCLRSLSMGLWSCYLPGSFHDFVIQSPLLYDNIYLIRFLDAVWHPTQNVCIQENCGESSQCPVWFQHVLRWTWTTDPESAALQLDPQGSNTRISFQVETRKDRRINSLDFSFRAIPSSIVCFNIQIHWRHLSQQQMELFVRLTMHHAF